MLLTTVELLKESDAMSAEITQGNFTTLERLHHFTAGLKTLFTQMSHDGIELVRTSCGGAGYSAWSGLPNLFSQQSAAPVYEGDNTVMSLQTSSYLEKLLKGIKKGKPAEGYFAYLNKLR